jgi:glutamine synthetase
VPRNEASLDNESAWFGAGFVDYYVHLKNAEIERFQAEVSDWEQREYFEMF